MATAWTPRATSPLRYSPVHYSPSDVLCPGSSDEDTPKFRATKKLNREALGREYLQDRPPVILSAGLRGPLHDGWLNPWKKAKRQSVDKPKVVPRFTAARTDIRKRDGGSSAESSSERDSSSEGSEISSADEPSNYPPANHRRHHPRNPPGSSEEDSPEDDIADGSISNPGRLWNRQDGSRGARKRPITAKKSTAPLVKLQGGKSGRIKPPTPTPNARRQNKRQVNLVSSSSSLEDTPSSEDEMDSRSKSAIKLASAIKEASKMKNKALREQTLAFCKGTEAIANQVNSLFPDISVPTGKSLRPPGSSPEIRKTSKVAKHNVHNQDQMRLLGRSNLQRFTNRANLKTVEIPIDFWAEPVRGLAGLVEMAQRLNDDMNRLTKESVQKRSKLMRDYPTPNEESEPMPKERMNQSGARRNGEALLACDQRPNEMSNRAATRSPHVIPPSTFQPEFVYNRASKASESTPEETASNTKPRIGKTPNVDEAFPSTDPGPATEKVKSDKAHAKLPKAPRRLSFSASGELMLEIRVPPRRTQGSPLRVFPKGSSNETSNASVAFPDGQVLSNQPGQRIKLPSEPSTNLLETDRQSLPVPTTDEGNSELIFSTQAAVARAQQAFQLDLESPARKIEKPSPLSTGGRKTRSMESSQTNVTPLGHVRDPFAGPLQRKLSDRLEEQAVSTQDLINKMTPFAITTVKKCTYKRRSSPTTSPSKRMRPRETESKYIGSGSDGASVNIETALTDPDVELSPKLGQFLNSYENTTGSIIDNKNKDQQKPSRVRDRLLPQSASLNQHLTEQRDRVENPKSNKGTSPSPPASRPPNRQQSGLAQPVHSQSSQNNLQGTNHQTKQVTLSATKSTPLPSSSKSRSSIPTTRSPTSQHAIPSHYQHRNTPGHSSSPGSLHTCTPRRRPQSQHSPFKPRSGLRSYRSSLSGMGLQLQDGQFQPLGWSLEDGIEEAGSWLGTWDLERELRKGNTEGSGQECGAGTGTGIGRRLSQRSSGRRKGKSGSR